MRAPRTSSDFCGWQVGDNVKFGWPNPHEGEGVIAALETDKRLKPLVITMRGGAARYTHLDQVERLKMTSA